MASGSPSDPHIIANETDSFTYDATTAEAYATTTPDNAITGGPAYMSEWFKWVGEGGALGSYATFHTTEENGTGGDPTIEVFTAPPTDTGPAPIASADSGAPITPNHPSVTFPLTSGMEYWIRVSYPRDNPQVTRQGTLYWSVGATPPSYTPGVYPAAILAAEADPTMDLYAWLRADSELKETPIDGSIPLHWPDETGYLWYDRNAISPHSSRAFVRYKADGIGGLPTFDMSQQPTGVNTGAYHAGVLEAPSITGKSPRPYISIYAVYRKTSLWSGETGSNWTGSLVGWATIFGFYDLEGNVEVDGGLVRTNGNPNDRTPAPGAVSSCYVGVATSQGWDTYQQLITEYIIESSGDAVYNSDPDPSRASGDDVATLFSSRMVEAAADGDIPANTHVTTRLNDFVDVFDDREWRNDSGGYNEPPFVLTPMSPISIAEGWIGSLPGEISEVVVIASDAPLTDEQDCAIRTELAAKYGITIENCAAAPEPDYEFPAWAAPDFPVFDDWYSGGFPDFTFDFDLGLGTGPDVGVVYLLGSMSYVRARADAWAPLFDPLSAPDFPDPWAGEANEGTSIPDGLGIRSERWSRFEVADTLVVRGVLTDRPAYLAASVSNVGRGVAPTVDAARPVPGDLVLPVAHRWRAGVDYAAGVWTSDGALAATAPAGFEPVAAPAQEYRISATETLARDALAFTGEHYLALPADTATAFTAYLVFSPDNGVGPFYGLLESPYMSDRTADPQAATVVDVGLRWRKDAVEVYLPMRILSYPIVDVLGADSQAPMFVALSMDLTAKMGRLMVLGARRLTKTFVLPTEATHVDTGFWVGRAGGDDATLTAADQRLFEMGLDPSAMTFGEMDQLASSLSVAYGISG